MMTRLIKVLQTYLAAPVASTTEDIDRDIAEELEFHLAERTHEGVARGLGESEARQAARQRFGDLTTIRRACRETDRSDLLICHHLHLTVTVGLIASLTSLLWARHTEGPVVASIEPGVLTRLEAIIDNTVQSQHGNSSARSVHNVILDEEQLTGDVVGQVTDDDGHPIADATVLVIVKRWPNGRYRQEPFTTTSGKDGRFHIEDVYDPQSKHAAHISVVDESHVLESGYQLQSTGELDQAAFRLGSSSPLKIRCEDHNGNAAAGVEVVPRKRVLADGQEHLVYFCGSAPVMQTSDEAGSVLLSGFQSGDTAVVYLRVPRGDWTQYEIVVPDTHEAVPIKLDTEVRSKPT